MSADTTESVLGGRRAELRVEITNAARVVAPVWPLERFVAVNPLLGLVDLGFEDAVAEAGRWFGARGYPGEAIPHPPARTMAESIDPELVAVVTAQVARWCALLVDPHGPLAIAAGCYTAWRQFAARDRGLARLSHGLSHEIISALPERADDAVLVALDRLGIGDADRPGELRGQLARLSGWAGYARWCDEWAGPDDPAPRLSLVEFLAIALGTDAAVWPRGRGHQPCVRASVEVTPEGRGGLATAAAREGLAAAESAYRRRLLDALEGAAAPGPDGPAAQVVCCIDARSELLRRHLEAEGPYDTLGFAGFFAIPIRVRPLGSAEAYPSAPVLLEPSVEIAELVDPAVPDRAEAVTRSRARRASGQAAIDDLAHNALAMYALAETAGWVFGPAALARTIVPRPRRGPDAASVTLVDPTSAFTLDERLAMAETALRTMGLTAGFAPVVLLCGHGATTTANAHAAALDCGACGGNRGGANARTLAAIINDPAVRDGLRDRGIAIGADTWFAAAEHDTTTDVVTLLDAHRAPVSHRAALDRLAADLIVAGQHAARDRLARLPGASSRPITGSGAGRRARARAGDWAQTRPEWGLARNAAFVIGPRDLTRAVDLDGRVFLHSYDAEADVEGAALEAIFTAPMVVAQWINAQYYFSTVEPDVFGAGDKALHNPVAGVGVLQGGGGDLLVGLPWQSVAGPDGPYHEPVRLLAVVEAPLARIDAVIARNPVLQQLFDGEWVHLAARADRDAPWFRRLPTGSWVPEAPRSGAGSTIAPDGVPA